MRAARFLGNERIDIIAVPRPTPGPGEVLVKVAFCGLCGSERKPYRLGLDLTPGHEVSGVVVDANGTDVAEGTRASVYLSLFCGECEDCREGLTNHCQHYRGLVGWDAPYHGGYADYVVVPARNLLPLRPEVSLEAGVLLLDTFGTAWRCLRLAAPSGDTRALAIGCGPLGLGVVAGLRAFGVEKVFASDFIESRREAAQQFGAQALVPEEAAELMTPDLIVEAAGQPEALSQAVRQVAHGGTVVMLGEPRQSWTFEPCHANMRKTYSLLRSWYFPIREFEANQQLVVDGAVRPEDFISHVLPLDQLDEAFALFNSGETRKVLVST